MLNRLFACTMHARYSLPGNDHMKLPGLLVSVKPKESLMLSDRNCTFAVNFGSSGT